MWENYVPTVVKLFYGIVEHIDIIAMWRLGFHLPFFGIPPSFPAIPPT